MNIRISKTLQLRKKIYDTKLWAVKNIKEKIEFYKIQLNKKCSEFEKQELTT